MYIDPGNSRKTNKVTRHISPRVKWQDFSLPIRKTAKSNIQTRIQSGGGDSSNPRNLSWDDFSWVEIKEAFDTLKPQLFPKIKAENGLFEAPSISSDIIKDKCFGLISLKSYDEDKPPGVFGKIMSSFPENSTIKTLHQAELFVPNKTKPLGKKKITTGDIEVTGVVKTWYMNVAFYGTAEDFEEMGKAENDFHREGFHLERLTDPQPIEQYFALPKETKALQPWIYIISSSWLSRLDIHVANLVIANLRFLLEKETRIILNYISHPNLKLNETCDLKLGRDPVLFLEAKTPVDARDEIRDGFNELFKKPLDSIL
jgi:hypothetical protein